MCGKVRGPEKGDRLVFRDRKRAGPKFWASGHAKMGRDIHGFKPRYADIKDSRADKGYLPPGNVLAYQRK